MRRNADVNVAPCTVQGRVTGPALPARARILTGAESDTAAALARRIALLHCGSSRGITGAKDS
jgi:uncharacterized protein